MRLNVRVVRVRASACFLAIQIINGSVCVSKLACVCFSEIRRDRENLISYLRHFFL